MARFPRSLQRQARIAQENARIHNGRYVWIPEWTDPVTGAKVPAPVMQSVKPVWTIFAGQLDCVSSNGKPYKQTVVCLTNGKTTEGWVKKRYGWKQGIGDVKRTAAVTKFGAITRIIRLKNYSYSTTGRVRHMDKRPRVMRMEGLSDYEFARYCFERTHRENALEVVLRTIPKKK